MNIEGMGPMGRVTIGPCLACRVLRIGWRSVNDLRSHMMEPMMGMRSGPGGRGGWWEVLDLDMEKKKKVVMRLRKMVRMMMNKNSIIE